MEKTDLPVIYGILEEPTSIGVQAYAIDGQTGEIISQHFCSSENFAKSDLGFTGPLMTKTAPGNDDPHSTIAFNDERRKKYQERYPEGYILEWVGSWHYNDKIIELREKTKNTGI